MSKNELVELAKKLPNAQHIVFERNPVYRKLSRGQSKGLHSKCHECPEIIQRFPYFSKLSKGGTHYYHIECAKKVGFL